MDHNNTNKAIVAFVILSVIVHGIIAYVIVKTNNDEQNIESIELVDQDELNQKPEYKAPPTPKKRIARRKPRVETPRVETPRVEKQVVETSSDEEKEALSQKETNSEEEVLPDLPETPLAEESDIVVDASENEVSAIEGASGGEGNVSGNSDGESSSGANGSDAAAIQELKKVAEIVEQSTGEAQAGDSSNVVSEQSSADAISDQKSQASKPGIQKEDGRKTYRVDRVEVVRPTSFKYPQVSRRLKEEGTAILRMFFDKNGNPQKIELVKSTGSIRLDDAARQGASTLRLKSLGYTFIYELPVRFQLDFTDQQLNNSIDFSDSLGKFKSQAQSR